MNIIENLSNSSARPVISRAMLPFDTYVAYSDPSVPSLPEKLTELTEAVGDVRIVVNDAPDILA